MTVTVYTRDSQLRRTGQVDDFTKLDLPLRFNDISTWQLTVDGDSPSADLLIAADGIVIVRDGVTLLSGPVLTRALTAADGTETLVCTGVDDTVWLDRRLALPVPAGPPYTAQAVDTRSGNAETVLRGFVEANAGPAAPVARQVPTLTLAPNLNRGAATTRSARFTNLLELAQSIAATGGIGFRIVQVGLGLQMQVYLPADRTDVAVFSTGLGNLAGYDYEQTLPTVTYAYVGGQGEGTARTIVEGAAAVSPFRAEAFIDQRNTNVLAELEQARAEALLDGAAASSLSLRPIDTDSVRFGAEYNLGDRVTVVVRTVQIVDVVREVRLVLDGSGETVTPVVGTAGAPSPQTPQLFTRLRRQARRLSQIERR